MTARTLRQYQVHLDQDNTSLVKVVERRICRSSFSWIEAYWAVVAGTAVRRDHESSSG